MSDRLLFAIVPAAGRSERMGRPKLLLPVGGTTIIGRMISLLKRAEIAETLVVVRPGDDALRREAAQHGATIVQPDLAPPDMRASVQAGLRVAEMRHSPSAEDGWLLAPADHPFLASEVLDALLQRWNRGDCSILVPTCQGRRGHPTIFRWEFAERVAEIPSDQGLNWLLRSHSDRLTEVQFDCPKAFQDVDTPDDYLALLAELDRG